MAELVKIQDLYKDVELAKSSDLLVALLNQPPLEAWIKTHPYIANYKYLPIDKIEYLLKKIFKQYRIEVIREGVAFNGVYVVVRVHYLNPVTSEWDYHDGIGAKELQVKKGASAADLSAINNGALAMAFPIAKTVAIKDACDHFGKLFGSDLNRKDVMNILPDDRLQNMPSIIDKINKTASEIKKNIIPDPKEIEVTSPEVITPEKEELPDFIPSVVSEFPDIYAPSVPETPSVPLIPSAPLPPSLPDNDDF